MGIRVLLLERGGVLVEVRLVSLGEVVVASMVVVRVGGGRSGFRHVQVVDLEGKLVCCVAGWVLVVGLEVMVFFARPAMPFVPFPGPRGLRREWEGRLVIADLRHCDLRSSTVFGIQT